MKQIISISIQSINSRDLKKIEETRAAIRTIKELAQDMRRTASGTKVECLEAVAKADTEETKDKTPAFSFFTWRFQTKNPRHKDKKARKHNVRTGLLQHGRNKSTCTVPG